MAKQIQVLRMSGKPVQPESLEAYEKDWREFYDKAAERAKLDMLKLMRFTRFGESVLSKKHGATTNVEMPKSDKQWRELIAKFQCPIMVTSRTDTNATVLLIMDTGAQ